MEERVSLQELAQGLSRRKDTTKREAESFLRTFFEVAEEFTLRDGVVRIKAFGTFKLLSVDSRQSVDISTGERIVIDPHSRVTFTPSTALRDAVNKPFSEFQTVVLSDETPTSEMEYVPEEQPVEQPVEQPAEEPQAEEANPNEDMKEQEEQPQPAEQAGGTTVVNQTNTTPTGLQKNSRGFQPTVVNAQYVENQTIQQVVSSAVTEELAKRKRMMISRGGVVACVLAALLLMLAAFLLGYVLAGGTVSLGLKDKPQAEQPAKPTPKPEAPKPMTKPAPKPEPAEEVNYAEQYPQVEGGEYWITGTREEHVMVAGDNLYNLARKAYGDKELAVYIITYNAFENPNNLLLGQKIKLPELKKKE